MASEYLKRASKTPATGEDDTRWIVAEMLAEIRTGGPSLPRAAYIVSVSLMAVTAFFVDPVYAKRIAGGVWQPRR